MQLEMKSKQSWTDNGQTTNEVHFHIEAVIQRCSAKKLFLKISRNSQENTCARASFLGVRSAILLNSRLRHWCFPVNFARLLKTYHSVYLYLLSICLVNIVINNSFFLIKKQKQSKSNNNNRKTKSNITEFRKKDLLFKWRLLILTMNKTNNENYTGIWNKAYIWGGFLGSHCGKLFFPHTGRGFHN